MQDRVWNKQFVLLFIMEFCLQVGIMISKPVIANYVVFLGAAVATAGVIAGANTLASLIMRPGTGIIADRVDKRTLLVVCALFFLISAAGCAVSDSVILVGVFVAAQGVAMALKAVTTIAITSLIVPPKRVGTGIGWISMLSTLGVAVGPALGSLIGGAFGYQACFAASAIILGVGFALAVVFRFIDPERSSSKQATHDTKEAACEKKKESLFASAFYAPTLPFAALSALSAVVSGSLSSFILLLADMGAVENGPLYFLVYSITAVLARPAAGRLSDAKGVSFVALPGFSLALLGMVVLVISGSTIAVIAAGLCMGLGQASAVSAIQAESVRGVDKAYIGRSTNTYYLGADIGATLGPMLGGAIIGAFGAQAYFGMDALMYAIAVGFFLVLMHMRKKAAA